MMKLTTKQVAEMYGVGVRRISAIARARGIAPAVIVGSAYLWSREQVERLRPGQRGRPAAK